MREDDLPFDRREALYRLVLAEAIAPRGQGPLTPRFKTLFARDTASFEARVRRAAASREPAR